MKSIINRALAAEKKLFTLLLAVAASVGTMFASTEIGDLYYNLDATNQTAEVTTQNIGEYSGDIIIPSSVTYNSVSYSVTSIGGLAFSNCIGLTSVTIPNSVTSIGDGAFISCTGLASVTIPNSITSIGNSAFEDCSGLTSLTIPNSVTSIGGRAFSRCTSLTSVTIPNSVTSIGGRAFYNCSGLISITNYATTPQSISSNVFHDVNTSTCVLNVPTKSVSLYQAADVWKEFTYILGVDDYTINYVDKDSQALYNHVVTLYVPVAPAITGFTFLKWVVVNGDLDDGITIQAVYQSTGPTSAPEVYTNPANPAQKLIRNGNVYILTDDKTYTITGQETIVP